MQSSFKCDYCGKTFVKEKTLAVHVCEKKRRHLARNDKNVQVGLLTYQKFYEFAQNGKTQKSFEDFAESQYYTAFVKFGSFVVNAAPLYPEHFIEWTVKSGVKLDHWCRDELYDKYLLELLKNEPADGAIQRTIKHMMDWADNNSAEWEHYFAYVNVNRATRDIREGRISPWLIFHTKSGKEMLTKMNDEQLEIVGLVIDPVYWKKRFRDRPLDVDLVKDIVKEANIL